MTGDVRPRIGQVLELAIESVGTAGVCIARHEGQVVFVRGALPGEHVRVQVVQASSSYLRADVVQVLTPSQQRVSPPCLLARVELPREQRCGGCDWQHATLPAQRELKRQVVAQQLARLAGITWNGTVEAVGTGVASPQAEDADAASLQPANAQVPGLGWRTRMQFAVAPEGSLGLRAARSHRVLPLAPVGGCSIAHPAMAQLVDAVRVPGCQAVEVTVDAHQRLHLVITGPAAAVREALPALRSTPSVGSVFRVESPPSHGKRCPRTGRGTRRQEPPSRRVVPVWRATDDPVLENHSPPQPEAVQMQALGRQWWAPAGGFWQVHRAAADILGAAVQAELIDLPLAGHTACDLYSGSGLFTGLLAEAVGPGGAVVAVESSPQAVAQARRNLAAYPQVRQVAAAVQADHLPQRAEVVVLDPPRAGAGAGVVAAIAALRPARVIYVSCDPATLARDIATFAEQGYRLASVRAFDLFPMTAHVECLAVLEP